jgi:S1-C subfamily serine protease
MQLKDPNPMFILRIVVIAVFVTFVSAPYSSAEAQSPPATLVTTMPETGLAIASYDNSRGSEVGDPLPDGTSFEKFGEILGAFRQTQKAMRGAQEIAAYRKAAPAVVLIKTNDASGSGVMLSNSLVLTNRHVVEGVGTVQIFFKPNEVNQTTEATEFRTGRVKYVDPQRDLAIIEVVNPPSDYKFLKIAANDDLEVGADVYAIGHPLGYTWTFTQGIVSGIRTIQNDTQNYTAIQTQTPINPGNSGGPLLNTNLEVVGINTWARVFSSINKENVKGEGVVVARPAQGLNFAVSARDIRNFFSDAKNGKIAVLELHVPTSPAGCKWQPIFSGRSKANDSGLKTFSSMCDGVADAWEIFPDDKSKPVQLHIDPNRSGKSSIVILSNAATGKWETSFWDFFRDRTFAVVGHHDDGTIKPTRFEFSKS